MLPLGAALLALVPCPEGAAAEPGQTPVDFQRQIQPLLSAQCFSCHGPDPQRRKAGLRLDTEEGSRVDLGGRAAVVPGAPDRSMILRRILSEDPEERMPPPSSHRSPSPGEVMLLRQWIAEGARYDRHWAFRPARRASLPQVRTVGWSRHPIDTFILARQEAEGLHPSPAAEPGVWLRRVGFDLIGLAPTPEEQEAFRRDVRSRGEAAYGAAVDRLLASPEFGERQAVPWLDLARYADTHGFNNDSTRTLWPWRDWVIRALNQGMPYDRFLSEQLAGDLLPGASIQQRVATGFCRNHVVNSEGGILDEEYRVEYVADRVRTLGMAALGLTLECARCHDHKYDPITQRDYYRLFAFFNQVPESGEDGRIGNAAPLLVAPDPATQDSLAGLDEAIRKATGMLEATPGPNPDEVVSALEAWRVGPELLAPADAGFVLSPSTSPAGQPHPIWGAVLATEGRTNLVLPVPPAGFSAAQPWTISSWVRWEGGEGPVASSMDLLPDPSAGGHGRGAEVRIAPGGRVEVRLAEFWPAYAVRVATEERLVAGEWGQLTVTYDGTPRASGVRVYLDGRVADLRVIRDGLTGKSGAVHALRVGATVAREPERLRVELGGFRWYPRAVGARELVPWVDHQATRWAVVHPEVLKQEGGEGSGRARVLRWARPGYAERWRARELLREQRQSLLRDSPQTMVMEDMHPGRPTHVLKRGHYAALGERVDPGVPEVLGEPWPEGAPSDRRGLAMWLTRPGHPLTARVAVNRFWAQLFGTGLVRTVEDLGVRGEYPTHPELLDWLAVDFVESGWDMKRLLRGLVLSATYRQASAWSPEDSRVDPANRWLARGPRVRLPAETLRDHLLNLGGVLERRLGGASVFPAQPESLYQGVVVAADYPGTRWIASSGADAHRRSLYTFWKRTVPHPVMTTFDAPDRESCLARRLPTNTPLQALALLNEPSFVEAAAGLAHRVGRQAGLSREQRLARMFECGTGRPPRAEELEVLSETLELVWRSMLADRRESEAEAAAWTSVGNLVLNLDQTITKD